MALLRGASLYLREARATKNFQRATEVPAP